MSERLRFIRDIPVRPRAKTERRPDARACAIAGCPEPGEFRAPESKTQLDRYRWLCLEHVREFNRSWDFFRDMSPAEVERFIKESSTGHRPTWSMGLRSQAAARAYAARLRTAAEWRDPFRVVQDGPSADPTREPPAPQGPYRTRLQREALESLELETTATLNEVTTRYKELVKRYHPDANGGDRSSEDRLKKVIRAYRLLRASKLA